jgi:hypothetical protein
MVIDMKSLDKLLGTLFPEPKYSISCYQGDHGFSLIVYIDTCEVFSISFFGTPMLAFRKPHRFADEYSTLKSIFDLDRVGLYRYDIKGFKDDSE